MTDFNHSFREKIPPFDKYAFTTYEDIERCPYTWKDPEYREWELKDARRIFLIWLDRYADALMGKRMFKPGDKVSYKIGDFIITGEVTIARKYESKVIWDSGFSIDLDYWYYPNWELTKI